MSKHTERERLNLIEATEFLAVSKDHVIELISSGKLPVKIKSPVANSWHILDPEAIKVAYESGYNFIELITLDETDNDIKDVWVDREISFEQLYIHVSDLADYKKNNLPKVLSASADFSTVKFGDDVFYFKPQQAKVIKALYDRYKNGTPQTHEKDIFDLAALADGGPSEARLDKFFRMNPTVIGTLIIKVDGKKATYRLADFIEK